MDRREFLKASALVSLSALWPGAAGWTFTHQDDSDSGKLIVIFLRGAFDGLNVLVPYSDPSYYRQRPTIAIPRPDHSDGCLNLDGDFGMHPALAPLTQLWKKGSLAFVLSSGSPDPTRSHFDAQDYMESGMPGVKVVSSGWLNRLLQVLPRTNSPLRGINIGSTMPRIMQGPVTVATYSPRRNKRRSLIDRPFIARAFSQMYEDRDDALGRAFREGVESHKMLQEKLNKEMVAANKGAPQARNFKGFGQQLGRLFGEDRKTQVAFLALGGWDTHVNQGASKGQLANQLKVLGAGLADLVKGLGEQYQKTTIVVMSEFGRTVKENGNGGTDHGHGNVMWVLGGGIAGGKLHGDWTGLQSSSLFEGRDMPVTTDFRDVIGTVLHHRMGVASTDLKKIFPEYNLNLRKVESLLV